MNLTNWLTDPKRKYADGVALLRALNHPRTAFFAKAEHQNPGIESFEFRMLVKTLQNAHRINVQHSKSDNPEPISIKVIEIAPPAFSKNKKFQKAIPTTPLKPTASAPSGEAASGSFRIADLDLIDIRQLPEDLQKNYKEIKVIFGDIAKTHAKMKAAKTDQDRKKLIDTLQSLENARVAKWDPINKWYEEHKSATVQEADAKTKEVDEKAKEAEIAEAAIRKHKRIDALKIYISRAKTQIESGNYSQKDIKKREGKIVAWEQELTDLQNE